MDVCSQIKTVKQFEEPENLIKKNTFIQKDNGDFFNQKVISRSINYDQAK
jgi:hypothetical protein